MPVQFNGPTTVIGRRESLKSWPVLPIMQR